MKEILDIIVWGGFIFLLFIFLRGFNQQQVQKHQDRLDEIEKRKNNINNKDEKQ